MKPVVYCRTTAKGQQTYYVKVNGENHYLFNAKYRVSNKETFRNGIRLDEINDFSTTHSKSVRKTKDKLPAYLSFIEKEYGVVIYDKKARKKDLGNRCGYKRSKIKAIQNLQDDDLMATEPSMRDDDIEGGDAA